MMKYTLLIILIPSLLWAQPFTFVQEYDSVQIEVENYILPEAWRYGYSQSAPAFCDLDGDEDFEIVVGKSEYGQMDLWTNLGTVQQPDFNFDENGLQTINEGSVTKPEFADIDADGDLDLFLFSSPYGMQVYTNIGTVTLPYFTLTDDTLNDILGNPIIGLSFDLADIDSDNDYDLFIGVLYTGNVKFYRNVGDSTAYAYQLITENFTGTGVGYWSSPEFFDIDADGDLDMFVGNQWGHVWYYRNDGTPQQWNFTYVTNNWLNIEVGDRADPEFCDIDGDGDLDLFIGKDNEDALQPPGDIHFWRNIGSPQIAQFVQENEMYLTFDLGRDLNDPEFVDIDHDGVTDLYVWYYYLGWLKNIGTATDPYFRLMGTQLGDPMIYWIGGAGFGDLNSDSYEDVVVTHAWSGELDFWISNGDTLNPSFTLVLNVDWGEFHGSPSLGDLDADGDQDMLLPGGDFITGGLRYYENQGTPEHFYFVLVEEDYQNLGAGGPVLVDFDFDGDLDLLGGVSYPDCRIAYYQNQGTPQQANMVLITEDLLGISCMSSTMPDFFDIDNDGDMDAIGGTNAGGLHFFRNVTGEPAVPPLRRHPQAGLQLSLGPNPANPVTWVTFHLPAPQKATLAIYNLLGQKVATLAQGLQPPGTQTYLWNASQFASGVYIVRLETPKYTSSQQITVIK